MNKKEHLFGILLSDSSLLLTVKNSIKKRERHSKKCGTDRESPTECESHRTHAKTLFYNTFQTVLKLTIIEL